MEHSDLCYEVEVKERCADCIADYFDGKAQLDEDTYRED